MMNLVNSLKMSSIISSKIKLNLMKIVAMRKVCLKVALKLRFRKERNLKKQSTDSML